MLHKDYYRKSSIGKKTLVVSLKELDAKMNWLVVNRQSSSNFDFDFDRSQSENENGWRLIVSYCNWFWLPEIVQEGVNKSNHLIQNQLLLVTEQ
jgi:hypothetical protein